MAKHTYQIVHVPGYASADHFTGEVVDGCSQNPCDSLVSARRTLRAAKRTHTNHPTEGRWALGRIDIVRSDGQRHAWA